MYDGVNCIFFFGKCFWILVLAALVFGSLCITSPLQPLLSFGTVTSFQKLNHLAHYARPLSCLWAELHSCVVEIDSLKAINLTKSGDVSTHLLALSLTLSKESIQSLDQIWSNSCGFEKEFSSDMRMPKCDSQPRCVTWHPSRPHSRRRKPSIFFKTNDQKMGQPTRMQHVASRLTATSTTTVKRFFLL